ncbi:MAG TPA: M1 family metallopeptidase [Pyrinomonadaceae bacterium]|nr:M1 family metallopeptidase [Pyrinomonadaceae bacterium]
MTNHSKHSFFRIATALIMVLFATVVIASGQTISRYDVVLEPDILNKSIKGSMTITLAKGSSKSIELQCGDLLIDSVSIDATPLKYSVDNHQLRIVLPAKATSNQLIKIEYHGAPRRGVRFFPDRMQVYTVFSTSQWMICLDDPNERASLRLRLIVPNNLATVGNGRFVNKRPVGSSKSEHDWQQDRPVPSYTYGFVIGRLYTVSERQGATKLNYLAEQYDREKLLKIFHDSADMMKFYEERSGVRYPGETYSQVLAAGGVEQEMAGFTALREKYGQSVLDNERDVWLGAHEMAHQWWGIGVGCQAWTHFWLNEGMATFMADAYKEHRFGREEYLKEIEASRKQYEKVKDAGKDRSLVFPDWLHPTAEDRTLVYDKGALVLHLLREEMGEKAFWSGLRAYTKKYFGKSVTTPDFQAAMQKASSKDLSPFFDKWVYLKK